jgi:hypothetical protein
VPENIASWMPDVADEKAVDGYVKALEKLFE